MSEHVISVAPQRSQRLERVVRVRRVHLPQYDRPRSRGDCVGVKRPCHFVACSMNLFLDFLPPSDPPNPLAPWGSVKFNFTHPSEMPRESSCALDVADRGEHTLEEIAGLCRVSDEWVRQIDLGARAKIAKVAEQSNDLRDAAELDERRKDRAKMIPPTPEPDGDEAAPTKEPRTRSQARRASNEVEKQEATPETPPDDSGAKGAPEQAAQTVSLVADLERARGRLRARRDQLREELALADGALSVDDDAEPAPEGESVSAVVRAMARDLATEGAKSVRASSPANAAANRAQAVADAIARMLDAQEGRSQR